MFLPKIDGCMSCPSRCRYRLASDIANRALELVLKNTTPGKTVLELCELGDKYINEQVEPIYKTGKITKGVGFPTCISINNIVGSFSPEKKVSHLLLVLFIGVTHHVTQYLYTDCALIVTFASFRMKLKSLKATW